MVGLILGGLAVEEAPSLQDQQEGPWIWARAAPVGSGLPFTHLHSHFLPPTYSDDHFPRGRNDGAK
jgi:hypothetical protein